MLSDKLDPFAMCRGITPTSTAATCRHRCACECHIRDTVKHLCYCRDCGNGHAQIDPVYMVAHMRTCHS